MQSKPNSEKSKKSQFADLEIPKSQFVTPVGRSQFEHLKAAAEVFEQADPIQQQLMIEMPEFAHPSMIGEMFGIPMVRLPIPGIDTFMKGQEKAIKFAIDAEEKPRRMAMNLGHLLWESKIGHGARVMARGVMPAEDVQEVAWKDVKQAIVDGWQGKQYSTLWDQIKRSGATREELDKYEQFLQRHKGIRYADRAIDLIGEFSTAIVMEAAMLGGARGVLKRVPKIGGMFDDVPEHVMRKGMNAAMEHKAQTVMKKGQFFDAMDNIANNRTLYREFDWDALEVAFGRDVRVEFLNAVTKPAKEGAKPLVQKSIVNRLADSISLGKHKKIADLSPAELAVLADDVTAILKAPKKLSMLTQVGADFGGVPSWNVLERLGLRRGYDAIDDAMFTVTVQQVDRGKWVSDKLKQYKKLFGKKWDEASDEAAAIIADEGPGAWVKIPQETVDQMSPDELRYIREMVEEDRLRHWEPLANRAEEMKLIGAGTKVPRHEFYYHHRRRIHEMMKRRVRNKNTIMPADYRMDKIMKRRVPAGVNVPEFFARHVEDADEISYAWRDVTRIAHREELRRLYVEPAAKRLSAIADASPYQIREAAQEYASDWMRYVRGMPSPIDEKMNRLLAKGVETVTLGRVRLAERSFERFSNGMRRYIITGTIGFNPRSVMKNMTQSLLTVNTIGHRATMAGWESMFTEGGRRLLGKYNVMSGGRRLAMAEVDIASRQGWERLSTLGFAAVDKYINCAGAGNGALWKVVTGSTKYMDDLVEHGAEMGIRANAVKGAKFWEVLSDAVDAGKFEDALYLANRNIKFTQYSYNPWDMPRHLWSQTGKNAFMFTTWPSNFFGSHLPQLWHQLIKGGDVFGQAVTPAQRLALISFTMKGATLFAIGRKLGYNLDHLFLTGPMPVGRVHGYLQVPAPVTPPTELALALGSVGMGALTANDNLIDNGVTGLKNIWAPFVPGGTVGRQVIRAARGEVPLQAIILPKRIKQPKKLKWRLPAFGDGLKSLPKLPGS